jgi:hypothetical protein
VLSSFLYSFTVLQEGHRYWLGYFRGFANGSVRYDSLIAALDLTRNSKSHTIFYVYFWPGIH